MTYEQISKVAGVTQRKVQRAVTKTLPKPRPGRPQSLSWFQTDELVRYVEQNPYSSSKQLAERVFPEWNVSHHAIKTALSNRGYFRTLAQTNLARSNSDRS
jgi:transposase